MKTEGEVYRLYQRDESWFLEIDYKDRSFDACENLKLVKTRCRCCEKCWAYTLSDGKLIRGPRGVICVHGGPYLGYTDG